MREQDIQATFVGRLRQLQVRLESTTAEKWVVFFHPPNEGKRGPQARNQARALGMSAGVPDLFVFFSHTLRVYGFNRRMLVIEFKSTTGKPTHSQLEWLAKLETLPNTGCFVIDSLADVGDLITEIELAYSRLL